MNPVDIELYTDGSGHENGYGGWAAFVTTPNRKVKEFRMGYASGTSVDRMEFTALLEGLQCVLEISYKLPRSTLQPEMLRIAWFTDRENLFRSVKGIYNRSNCLDLWVRFEFYERQFHIMPNFVDKAMAESIPAFREVDMQASAGYQQVKNYLSVFPFSPTFTDLK